MANMQQVAEKTGMDARAIRRLLRTGKIKGKKTEEGWGEIDMASVNAYMKAKDAPKASADGKGGKTTKKASGKKAAKAAAEPASRRARARKEPSGQEPDTAEDGGTESEEEEAPAVEDLVEESEDLADETDEEEELEEEDGEGDEGE